MPQTNSVNQDEIASFERLADEWWDENGSFKPLHRINPVRLTYLRQTICAHFGRDAETLSSLDKLEILDVGCGGGLICEPLSRMGATVTGLDAGEENIRAAEIHAEQEGLDITYIADAAENIVEDHAQKFDVVLALEIIEHVDNPEDFVETLTKLVKPDGLIIFSTLNRTLKSLALGKIAAEYILNLVPKGTHDWKKFVKPSELSRWLSFANFELNGLKGMVFDPLTQDFKLSDRDLDINYFLSAVQKG